MAPTSASVTTRQTHTDTHCVFIVCVCVCVCVCVTACDFASARRAVERNKLQNL